MRISIASLLQRRAHRRTYVSLRPPILVLSTVQPLRRDPQGFPKSRKAVRDRFPNNHDLFNTTRTQISHSASTMPMPMPKICPVLQIRRAPLSKMQYKLISRSRPTRRLFHTWPPSPSLSTLGSFLPLSIPPHVLLLRTIYIFMLAHLFLTHVGMIASAWGPSMLPTFEILTGGLVVSKLHGRGRGVCVGDLVTYDIPINNQLGVKRVLGLPGDYVLMGTPADGETGWAAAGRDAVIKVPPGHCWLVGDNLAASRDSRHFGPVPLALVRGKVVAQIWPFHKFRILENPLDDPPST